MKTVASKIFRTDVSNSEGEPVYMVRSQNIIDVIAVEGEAKVH